MTTIAPTTTPSFFEQAFERIAAFAHEHQARRRQRIALATLMEMDAVRLDDLGINPQDVMDAFATQDEAGFLEGRRAQRALTWSPETPVNA